MFSSFAGAVLAPGKRTVSEALRVMGLAARPGFARYHEVLSRARWNGRAVARKLLAQVLDVFLPTGEVVIGIDDTIERRRRWGAKIKARGIYGRVHSGAYRAMPARRIKTKCVMHYLDQDKMCEASIATWIQRGCSG